MTRRRTVCLFPQRSLRGLRCRWMLGRHPSLSRVPGSVFRGRPSLGRRPDPRPRGRVAGGVRPRASARSVSGAGFVRGRPGRVYAYADRRRASPDVCAGLHLNPARSHAGAFHVDFDGPLALVIAALSQSTREKDVGLGDTAEAWRP